MPAGHVPVLIPEIIAAFAPVPGDRLLDATIGHGGHAAAFLEASIPSGTVVGFDADEQALAEVSQNLSKYKDRVTLLHNNFSHLKDSVLGGGILHKGFTHVLFDLGIGSHQLADLSRGFSFKGEGLTMRYGNQELPPAQLESLNRLTAQLGSYPDVAEIVTYLSVEDIAEILKVYGEERLSGQVAEALKQKPLPQSSRALAERVAQAVTKGYEHGRIHPATRTFQALRLAVNRELEALTAALPQAIEVLAPQGKIAVISFHSLEDRIVKQYFRAQAAKCSCPPEQPVCTCDRKPNLLLLTKHPLRASPEEIRRNPRARSAKLRIAQKTGP